MRKVGKHPLSDLFNPAPEDLATMKEMHSKQIERGKMDTTLVQTSQAEEVLKACGFEDIEFSPTVFNFNLDFYSKEK